jgi:GT2 family glycosyltransferase
VNDPFVSVIVPTFRRFDPLLGTLRDLLNQDYPLFEIVVADQNPQWPEDLTAPRVRIQADPRVRWLRLERPGVVAARNAAAAASIGEILLFVDDDVLVSDRTWIRRHAENFGDPTIAATVGRERQVVDDTTPPVEPSGRGDAATLPAPRDWSALQQAMWFNRNADRRQYVSTFSTCNGSIRRSAFLSVGGFDEAFGGHSYGDDYDLALRLDGRGFRAVYDPTAWLVHLRAPLGGLRLTDPSNTADGVLLAQGLWLFVLRHGYRGMYWRLVKDHVLRKTVLLRRNVIRPWRSARAVVDVAQGFRLARMKVGR